jgi:transcription initiation factor TFIID subunit TAF12
VRCLQQERQQQQQQQQQQQRLRQRGSSSFMFACAAAASVQCLKQQLHHPNHIFHLRTAAAKTHVGPIDHINAQCV